MNGNILKIAHQQKALGVKQGIEAACAILSAAVWNTSDELGFTDEQRARVYGVFKDEMNNMLRTVSQCSSTAQLEENAEYIVGKANELRRRMVSDEQ